MSTERKRPLSSQEFKEVYSKVARLTVEAFIPTPKGPLLSLREGDGWEGYWHIPGGTVLFGETLEETARRVAQEELEMDVAPTKGLGFIYYPTEVEVHGFGWTIGYIMSCVPDKPFVSNNPNIKPSEHLPREAKIIPEQRIFLEHMGLLARY